NVLAYHRLGDLFIAEFEKSELKALRDEGLSYQIIDEEPWTESYYVISESKRCEQVDLSQYGRVLVQMEDFYFLKISDEGARSLAEKGYYIVKVFRHAIPLKYKPATEEVPRSSLYDPSIDSLLSLISADSLYAWDLRLQNFQTRYSYSDSIHAARQWLFDKFVSFGIDSVWFHHYFYDSDQYNVVATVVGTAQPDKVIVVGGHYDSVVYGAGTDPYVWAPGADDNASGTAATLEMARIVAENPLPVTVIFSPFAQEEQGLIGSDYFAGYLYNQGTDVHLMINGDMIGHSVDADTDVIIYGHSSAWEFITLMMDMANTYTYLNPSYGGMSYGSDHYSFYQWGYDAVFAHEGDFHYAGWHTNYDTVDSLDFDYMKEVVKMELATLITVARSFGPPYMIGDANGDDMINGADVVFLLNYLFLNGPAPDPLGRGDVNCDDEVNIEDVIFLVNYLYIGGPPPPASC
ncbi:MAG: M20/M25/M40 family metallo-hydrolase, partial [Candidatus Zixiibacteriota bacterium]